MNPSDIKTLARWKHVEVIYDRLSSGGLNKRQHDRLYAELDHALGQFRLKCANGKGSIDAYERPASTSFLLMP